MSGGQGSNDGTINLRGVIRGGELVDILDHQGKSLGAPVFSKTDLVTGGIEIPFVVMGRTLNQLQSAPTDNDIASGDSTIFYDMDDPTKRYAMTSDHAEFVSISGSSGGGSVLNYSTTEQLTGATWINGKSIYRRTFDVSPAVAPDGTVLIPSGVTAIIMQYGFVSNEFDAQYSVYDQISANTFRAKLTISTGAVSIMRSGTLFSGKPGDALTLEYTK